MIMILKDSVNMLLKNSMKKRLKPHKTVTQMILNSKC